MEAHIKKIGVVVLFFIIPVSYAWNVGAKGRVTGPSIHTTYFLTPNNGEFKVSAQAYVGFFANGSCQYNAVYDLGTDNLKTGDMVQIDGFSLKSLIGSGYDCMTIFYTNNQLVIETFKLRSDGINYVSSEPRENRISIL